MPLMQPAPGPGKRRLLVTEDEADLATLLDHNLTAAGHLVRTAANGTEGLRQWEAFEPELVLLDVMLPDMSGFEVCRRIRSTRDRKQPAIVMLTARAEEVDRVVGFEVGVDDYIVKPFSLRELLLRIGRRLQDRDDRLKEAAPRVAENAPPRAQSRRVYRLRELTVDPEGFHVYVAGREVHMSAQEMKLLVHLFEAQGQVRSRHDLLVEAWGYSAGVTSRTVDTHVKRLRDKFGSAGALIETVRGLGYRLATSESLAMPQADDDPLDQGPIESTSKE